MNKTSQLTASATLLLVGLASAAQAQTPAHWYDSYRNRATVDVRGTLWDFYKKNRREMDVDFNEHGPKGPKGQYIGIMKEDLDADGKPVFDTGGFRVDVPWTNMDNSPIKWCEEYIATFAGDKPGKLHPEHVDAHHKRKSPGDAVTPEEDVPHWFRDDPGQNIAYESPITFIRTFAPIGPPDLVGPKDKAPKPPKNPAPLVSVGTGDAPTGEEAVYVFDSLIPKGPKKHHEPHAPKPPKPEYKPGNDALGAQVAGDPKKKRYTFEGETTFIFERGQIVPVAQHALTKKEKHERDEAAKHGRPIPAAPTQRDGGWWLSVEAQDDVWVYIDNKLVVDLGGSYKGKEKREFCSQLIELDRLGWLQEGGTYTLKVFVADRDKDSDKSHLKIRTNIPTLGLVGMPVRKPECD